MKELNKKVFKTIFLLLSIFIIFGISIYNIQNYRKEYDNVRRNLTFNESKNDFKYNDEKPKFKEFDNPILNENDKNLDNMLIMDYEVYTVKLSDNKINRIIKHGNSTSDFDVQNIAEIIINKDKGLKVGNLYNNKYSYNYNEDTIVIINTKKINDKLLFTLIESIIFLICFEIVIFYISKSLTKRITKPAIESFDKQKNFIADASHELKTPLAIIMASSDEIKSDKKNKKYIDNIKYESERMNNLIKNLLDLSKLENGIEQGNYKEENLSNIIERLVLTFESIAYEQNVLINTNIQKDIMFNCYKEDIEKLISVILDNAIKHSYKDTSITVNVNQEKNNISIEIINIGEPIKSGEEEKIFERFYRSDKSRNRDSNRYGLGLAIAKRIVINHNGVIKAFSKDNKTTFKIILKNKNI